MDRLHRRLRYQFEEHHAGSPVDGDHEPSGTALPGDDEVDLKVPILVLCSIYRGLSCIDLLPGSLTNFPRFPPLRPFFGFPNFLPYGVSAYLLIQNADTYGRCVSACFSLPDIASGECPAARSFSAYARSSGCAVIFIPRNLPRLLLTRAFPSAFPGSYSPFTVFLRISRDSAPADRFIVRAMSRREYPFSSSIATSFLSTFVM